MKIKNFFKLKTLGLNWKIKLGSFFISIILYMGLQNSKIEEKELNLKIVYPRLTDNFIYSEGRQNFVAIRVKGFEDNINSRFIKASVQLKDLKDSKNSFKKEEFYVPIHYYTDLPNDLKLFPSQKMVKISIEERIKKIVPIEVGFVEQQPNIKIEHYIVPKRVSIYGTKKNLKEIRKITLPNISLRNKKSSFNKTINLPSLPGQLSYSKNIKNAEVIILITNSEEKQDVNPETKFLSVNLPVQCSISNSQYNVSFSKSDAEVTLSYEHNIEKNSEFMDYIKKMIKLRVNCYYVKDESDNRPIVSKFVNIKSQNKIKDISILDIEPKKIEIFFSQKPENKGKDFSQELIKKEKI